MVEFALVAPAFLALLIAVFETALFLFAQQTLQTAAVQAGRLFLTGSAQTAGTGQSDFATAICPNIQAIFNCNNLMVDVQTYSQFSGANVSSPSLTFDANGNVTNTWSYVTGIQGQIMVIRLIYLWPIVGGPLGYLLPNTHAGTTEMMGVSAFRVEPY
jgi:Flp pilus assembly protein TadG